MHTATNACCRLIAVQDLFFSISFLITIFKANGLISSEGQNIFQGGFAYWPRAGCALAPGGKQHFCAPTNNSCRV